MMSLRSGSNSVVLRSMPFLLFLALALGGCGGSSPPEPSSPEPSASRSEVGADAYADRPALEVLRGRASYYSDRLAGRTTANGDIYDPRAFTAASRDLAFGTIVRVIREDTGASVIVRINDRGPFRDHSRILDLSRAAAEELDMIQAGVVPIRAEIIEIPARRR